MLKVSTNVSKSFLALLAVGVSAFAAHAQGFHNAPASVKQLKNPYEGQPPAATKRLFHLDCARCHGKDYAGLAAPSIVGYAATQSREMFIRMVLDGDPIRGMPGYRGNAYVAENLDDIYRYFLARANGEIGPDYRPPVPAERR